MINDASVQAVDASRWQDGLVKPLYDIYGFAQIPNLIGSLFEEEESALRASLLGPLSARYERVVLLLIDAFGWRFFQQYHARYPFLSRFLTDGVVTKLTSQFPSTTAAHITTIHTGLPVGRSGVYEWFYYEPLLDTMIAPLSFSYAEDADRNTLERAGVSPHRLLPAETLYRRLRRQMVPSFVVQSQDFTPSPFTNAVCDGAQQVPFTTLEDGLTQLADIAAGHNGRFYCYLYFGGIDRAAHGNGIDSEEFAAEVDTCFTMLESILHAGLASQRKHTLLLMTADHGHIEVDPSRTIYLDTVVPAIQGWMESNRQGRALLPAGFQRDLFLHIRPEHLDEACDALRQALAGQADIYLVHDLIDEGFFGGGRPSPQFLGRVGNVLILPRENGTVWWSQQRFPRSFPYHGQHGGLNPKEAETLLLALSYK